MKRLLFFLVAVALLAGCSSSLYQQGRRAATEGNYDRAIDLYYQEIAANPQSAEAWREIGVAFYKQDDFDKAEEALKQASAIRPDARTHLFLGLLHEKRENIDAALDAYGTALSLGPSGDTEKLLHAHVDRLLKERVELEVQQALAGEEELQAAEIPENTIAVAGFNATGLREDLRPIARGLAEFTAIDLSKISSIRVVDRLKIETIMRELQMAQSGAVDPTTAPRMGRLLGSRHIVSATVLGLGEEGIRLDGIVVNTVDSTVGRTETREGELRRLFAVQKEFVFRVIDDLGIKLTAEERDAIAAVPTESLLAFLAFSRGLEHQAMGNLNAAEASFNEATQADPGFGAAASRAAVVQGSMALSAAGGSFGAFESMVIDEGALMQAAGNVEGTVSTITTNIGLIPDLSSLRPVDQPPMTEEMVPVTISGDLNGN